MVIQYRRARTPSCSLIRTRTAGGCVAEAAQCGMPACGIGTISSSNLGINPVHNKTLVKPIQRTVVLLSLTWPRPEGRAEIGSSSSSSAAANRSSLCALRAPKSQPRTGPREQTTKRTHERRADMCLESRCALRADRLFARKQVGWAA